MRIGIIGAGRIGGNLARVLSAAGHEITVSFSRDTSKLGELAAGIGAQAGTPAEAVRQADAVVSAVPWPAVDIALGQVGDLRGKLVIDTTNQFTRAGIPDLGGDSGARHNARKAPAAKWAKAFNTLTAGFQASSAGRAGPDRVVMFYATDHEDVVATVERLISDAGFDPVRTGGLDRNDVGHQEPKGDLYGEEFHHGDAVTLIHKLRGTPPSGRGRP
jgi:predicted dinucleotide-binding enzyme